jgi:hypothetical protein
LASVPPADCALRAGAYSRAGGLDLPALRIAGSAGHFTSHRTTVGECYKVIADRIQVIV